MATIAPSVARRGLRSGVSDGPQASALRPSCTGDGRGWTTTRAKRFYRRRVDINSKLDMVMTRYQAAIY